MGRTVAITFIRHGATINNQQNVYQGWSDTPLLRSEKERLARTKHRYVQPDYLLSSDLIRCYETARTLFPNCEMNRSAQFRELHFGDFEGKSYEQLKDDKAYQHWLANPALFPPPNGEAYGTFTERLQQGWELFITDSIDDNKECAIVTHGGVIRYFLSQYAPEKKSFWDWSVPFGGGYRLLTTKERLRGDERCISLSEVPSMERQNG